MLTQCLVTTFLRGFDFDTALMSHTSKNFAATGLPCMDAKRDQLFNSHQNVNSMWYVKSEIHMLRQILKDQ